jgi:hypothetical protein
MAGQVKQSFNEFIMLGTGGKGSTSVGFLREFGIRTCWMIPDHPVKNGDEWALSVLGDRSNFTAGGEFIKPMDFKVFGWPVTIGGHDLDEAVQKNGYATMVDALLKQRMVNFKNSFRWLKSKADDDLVKTKQVYDSRLNALDSLEDGYLIQRDNLVDEKRRKIFDAIHKWFRYIHDVTDRLTFTREYQESEGLDSTQVDEINKAAHSLNTVDEVVNRVKEALEEYFTPSYYEQISTEPSIYMWSKINKELFKFHSSEKEFFKMLGLLLGQDPIRWMINLLGKNEVLMEGQPDLNTLKGKTQLEKNVKTILTQALREMFNNVPSKNSLKLLGQGIHSLKKSSDQNKDVLYFVNGPSVCKGHFETDGQLVWNKVPSNVDDGILFQDLSSSATWSSVRKCEELEKAPDVDLQQQFEMIKKILDGWKFEHHEVVVRFLAAYIMSCPAMCALGNVNIIYLSGEKETGKTTLLTLISAANGSVDNGSGLPILEAAKNCFNITLAGVYQNFSGGTLVLVVDEAEVSNKHNTNHDKSMQELLRMLHGLPMGAVPVDRGGVTPDQKRHYQLRMPVILAGINMPTDPVLLSRIMPIHTVKDPGRIYPLDYIRDIYNPDELNALKQQITIGLLPHIPQLMSIKKELNESLRQINNDAGFKSNRFVDMVLTPLAVYKLIGQDPCELYRQILSCFKHRLESIHSQDDQNELLNACFYTQKIKIMGERPAPDYVCAKALIEKNAWTELNDSGAGVYFIDNYQWVVIVWRQVKHGLLANSQYMPCQRVS